MITNICFLKNLFQNALQNFTGSSKVLYFEINYGIAPGVSVCKWRSRGAGLYKLGERERGSDALSRRRHLTSPLRPSQHLGNLLLLFHSINHAITLSNNDFLALFIKWITNSHCFKCFFSFSLKKRIRSLFCNVFKTLQFLKFSH